MTDSRAPRLRVLVVDDEKNIRATLALCLEETGCDVEAAANGDAALAALERARFDVCFLDLRLANESGVDLIPKLLALRAAGLLEHPDVGGWLRSIVETAAGA